MDDAKEEPVLAQNRRDDFQEAIDTAVACKREIDRLADFILAEMPEEIGKGDPANGESAVDIAIRIMKEYKGRAASAAFSLGGD